MNDVIVMLTELFILIVLKNFCDKAFKCKRVKKRINLMLWTFFYAFSNVLSYLFDLSFLFKFLAFALPLLFVLHTLYEGVFEVKLAVVSFLYIMGMFSEVIVCIAGALFGYTIETALKTAETFLMYNILAKLVWFIEIKIAFVLLKKDRNVGIKKTDWLEVFFVPISSIFIIVSIFEPYAERYFTLKLAASFLLLIINLFSFYSYYSIQEKTFFIAEKKFLTQQLESYAMQLQDMGQMWEQMRLYRHEIQQKNLLVQSYIEQKDYEKIKNLFGETAEMLKSRQRISNTGNINIDTIINYKASIAEKQGITIVLDALVPYNVVFEDTDLYSLLGNLLDNAIEATKKVSQEEKYIKLQIRSSNTNLYVSMENPYSGELRKKNAHYLTTKPDKEEHGLGLRMVQDIVERHKGTLDINDKMGKFRIKVLVYDITRS